jgi:predicted metal-dependent enzyme (double-stranded beta helix superfamily)
MTVSVTTPALGRLRETAGALAADPSDWLTRVRLSPHGRWYERLHRDDDHEIWLISWLPGQSTGLHDHGGSRGAFAVALGELEEHDLGGRRLVTTRQVRSFGAEYVHEVRNISAAPAVSVHVYSPPLSTMNRYELSPDGNLVRLIEETAAQW